MKYGVSRAIAKTLVENGVDHCFFVTGGDQPFWISLKEAEVKLVLARSEASAVYMADGFARVSGRPALTYGQWGPGAANVAAALADAWWARSPVVALTSAINLNNENKNDYQELDQASMFNAVTKWNRAVKKPERAAELLREAIRVATTGVPRPVHIDVPRDILAGPGEVDEGYRVVGVNSVPAPDGGAVAQAVSMLKEAERPLILAGNGILLAGGTAELQALVDLTGIPCATSMGGKGSISETHPLALGVVGRYSRKAGNRLFGQADLVLAIGTDLGGMVTNGYQLPKQGVRIIQIDISPEILGTCRQVDLPVNADAKLALAALCDAINHAPLGDRHAAWSQQARTEISDWHQRFAEIAAQPDGDGYVRQEAVLQVVSDRLGADDIVVSDTGYMGAWTGALIPIKKAGRQFIRAAGSLGWAFPAGLGAQLARPDARVFTISGDGGIGYHIGDLETAVRLAIPAITLVLNNNSLAFEYHMQKYHYENTIVPEVNDYAEIDHGAVARAFGAYGAKVRTRAELEKALDEAIAQRKPALIDVVVSKERYAPVTSHENVEERDL